MKDFWDARYSEDGFAYGVEANDFLKSTYSEISPGGKVLCLSEGEGRNAIFLAQQGFDVTAIDLSSVGLKKAQERANNEGIKLTTIVTDVNDFDFGFESWDGIISIFGHLPSNIRTKVHEKIFPSLKKDGVYIFEAYTPEQLLLKTGGPKDESMMLTLSIVDKELFQLSPSIKRTCVRDIQEGKYHRGLSAVLQYLGKKY
jgi:2-polyprenyl-3-methyl-5-hydroxy-6-metoxy-1,4-benzoquinol methylase